MNLGAAALKAVWTGAALCTLRAATVLRREVLRGRARARERRESISKI